MIDVLATLPTQPSSWLPFRRMIKPRWSMFAVIMWQQWNASMAGLTATDVRLIRRWWLTLWEAFSVALLILCAVSDICSSIFMHFSDFVCVYINLRWVQWIEQSLWGTWRTTQTIDPKSKALRFISFCYPRSIGVIREFSIIKIKYFSFLFWLRWIKWEIDHQQKNKKTLPKAKI